MATPTPRLPSQAGDKDALTVLHHWVGVTKAAVMGVLFLWAAFAAWADGRPATSMTAAIISIGLLILAFALYTGAIAALWTAAVCLGFGLTFWAGMSAADAEAGRERGPIKLRLEHRNNEHGRMGIA
jgi:hypothetical protein